MSLVGLVSLPPPPQGKREGDSDACHHHNIVSLYLPSDGWRMAEPELRPTILSITRTAPPWYTRT